MLHKITDELFIDIDKIIAVQKVKHDHPEEHYIIHIEYKSGTMYYIDSREVESIDDILKKISECIQGDEGK